MFEMWLRDHDTPGRPSYMKKRTLDDYAAMGILDDLIAQAEIAGGPTAAQRIRDIVAGKEVDPPGDPLAGIIPPAPEGAIPRDTRPVPGARKRKPAPTPQPTKEDADNATPTTIGRVVEAENASDSEFDEAQQALTGTDVGAPDAPLAPVDPEALYQGFTGLVSTEITKAGQSLASGSAAERRLLREYEARGLLEPLLAGAPNDIERARLRALLNEQAAPETPPPSPGEGASPPPGGGNIPRAPSGEGGGGRGRGGGGERFGAPAERPQRIVVWDDAGGSYGFDTLPSVEDKLATMMRHTNWTAIADRLMQIPGGGDIVRVVSGSGGLSRSDPLVRAQIAREALAEQFDHDIAPAFARLEAIGTERRVWGERDHIGKVKATLADGRQTRVWIQEIIENPKRFTLNDQQAAWTAFAVRLTEIPHEVLTKMGKRVRTLKMPPDMNFTGLVLVKKVDASGEVIERGWVPTATRKDLAAQAPFAQDRKFRTLGDAIAAGFSPEPSYMHNLRLRFQQAGRHAVNIRVSDYIAQSLKRTYDAQLARNQFERQQRARAPGEIEPFERIGEGFGAAVDVLTPNPNPLLGFQRRDRLLRGSQEVSARGELEGVQLRKDKGDLRMGEALIQLQLNSRKEGVRERRFRIYGPQARALAGFLSEMVNEQELARYDKLVQGAEKFGAVSRLGVLALDFSVWFMQAGFAALGHPKAALWGRRGEQARAPVVGEMGREFVRSLFTPDQAREARADLIRRFADGGGYERHPGLLTDYLGFSEFTEATEGVLGRIPVAGEALRRFSLSFDYLRDIVAVRWAELGDEAGLSPQQLADHDRIINEMLGRISTRGLGIGRRQRMYEGALFFLAPKYFRATTALLANLVEGGASSRMAMKMAGTSMGIFIALVMGLHVGMSVLRGESEEQIASGTGRLINPTSREFLSARVGFGDSQFRVGLGGMPRAFLSLVAEMAVGEEAMTGQAKYGEAGALGQRFGTLERFWEARQAPATNLAWQYIRREDFVGRDTGLTPQGIAWLATSNFLPIFLQSAIASFDINDWKRDLGSAAARYGGMVSTGFLGLNSRDLSAGDVREWGTRGIWPDRSYDELASWERDWVNERAWPQLVRLYANRAAEQAEPVSSANAAIQRHDARMEREGKLLEAALNPSLEPFQRYTNWIKADEHERGRRAEISNLYSLLFGERPADVDRNELEEAFSQWIALLDEPDEARKQELLAEFDAAHPPDSPVGRHIRANTNTRRVPLPLLQQLATYTRAQSAYDSAMVRMRMVYECVLEETDDPWSATMAASQYQRWWLMLDETANQMALAESG